MKNFKRLFAIRLSVVLVVLVATLVATAIMTRSALTQSSAQTQPAIMEKASAMIDGDRNGNGKISPPESKPSPPAGKVGPGAAPNPLPDLVTGTTYPFTSAAGVSLEDMSSGTTTLVAAGSDDGNSALTNIGFEYWYDGVRFTQFGVNANGFARLGAAPTGLSFDNSAEFATTTNAPKICAYFDDVWIGTNGKAHFKVIGSAPNRKLVVEWQNETIPRQAVVTTGAGTFQMWLHESAHSTLPGVIEYVYGNGIVLNSAEGGYSIGLQSGAATNFASVTSTGPTVSYAVANNTQTNAITSGTAYLFTPNVPAAPSGMGIDLITQTSMRLNWGDNATNEVGYVIYRSTDNVTFNFLTQIAAGSTSFTDTGLVPSTQYFYLINAVSEGALSTNLALSASTSPAGNIVSTATGGNWSAGATWVGGIVPGPLDNATIVTGATVTIDSSNCLNLTVQTGAILQYEATTARTLTVGQSVTIDSGGVFQSNAGGTQTGHVLSIGANLTNNGTIDFSTNGNTAAAGIVFTGATDASFTLGAGSTTDLKQSVSGAGVTLNKGTNNTPILTFIPGGTFTVLGANVQGFLAITNGTFKLSGANAFSNPVFNVAGYAIPATGGFWMNNTNATVVAQNGTGTVTGLFRMTLGTFNVGTGAGSALAFATGANINVEGGAINSSGRFAITAAGNAITYNQTGGTITVCTVGNVSTTLASFDLGTGVGTTNISGGTIVVQLANTIGSGPRDYRNQSGLTGTATVTGGTLQMGNAASGAAKSFSIAGVVPNLVLNNASAGHTTTFLAPAVFNNVTKDVTINVGNNLIIANVFLMNGTTFTNNGTLTATAAGVNFIWFLTTAPVSYTGSGTSVAPMTNFSVQADMGLTIDPASPNIVVTRINLFSGGITNSNKLTLGSGGATTGVIQVGNSTTPTNAGLFDTALTFNLGSGGQIMLYLRTTLTRTTGPEINPTRILTSMSYDDNDPTHSLAIAGGDLTLSSAATALTMTNGRVVTGANTLILSSGAAAVSRPAPGGHVDGNFRKTYAAAANKTFEVGTANAFSPVAVDITAGTFPTDFTVKAVQGPQPNIGSPTHALQRYWVLTGTGVTANLTFTYASDAIDVPVTAQEGFFVILKFDGMFTQLGTSANVNTAANTATITGVTSFSDWTLAEPNAPTAIALSSLTATEYDTGTHIQWQTGAEVRNLGFNIYRDDGGRRTRVNPQLIGGAALLAGSDTVLKSGKSYSWWIGSASGKSGGSQFWLEDVDLGGLSTWHGPIGAKRVGGSPPSTSDAALLSRVGAGESQAASSGQINSSAALTRVAPPQIKLQSELAGKQAVKVSVRREGWYRVSQADLLAAGFNVKADPQTIQMYVDGRQIPISVITNQKQISAVDFYGRGIDASHTDTRVYWLAAGTQPGLRVQQVKGDGYAATAGSFLYTVERKDKTIYFSALRNGDKENFFGPVIASEPVDQTLNLQHVDQASTGQAQLEVSLQGVTQLPHRVWAYLNGTFAGELMFMGQAEGVAKLPVSHSLLREGDNQVRLVAQGGPSDVSLAGYVRLGYFHSYTADNNALRFTATGGQAVTIGGFGSAAIRVLDVTDPDAVREVLGKVQPVDSGYSITVASPQSGERVLVAGIDDARSTPVSVIDNRPSNLRSPEHAANLVIIANRETLSSVEPLRVKRASQGFKVEVVDVEDVFDEFTFGNKSPYAVRDFLLHTQSGWKLAPQYVLLVGDASLDPKGYLGYADSDLVPTRLIDTALMETSSDDGLTDFDGDGMPELAMGRLPVRNAEEAARMIAKIIGYDQSGPSRNVMLVADGNDGFDFESASRGLVSLIPGNIRVDLLNRGQLDPAIARAQLIDAINKGEKVVNYLGHGSVNVWRGGLLTNDDAAAMVNIGRLPLFVMMTCLNGYFQDPALDSLAESLMKSRGGAVAVWASSGMTGPDGQAAINRQVFDLIFRSSNIKGQPPTLGEATMRAKRGVGDIDVRRTYMLFGDPTTRLR